MTLFLFDLKKKLLLPRQRRAFRDRDFCIVSNNCWGAHVYQALDRPYQTPFIGLFLMPDCYLNLLENFQDIVRRPLLFKKESRHESINRNRSETNQLYPIAELAPGVEIQFLHYASEQEALAKWSRRVLRIPPPTENQKLFFKFCDRDGLTQNHLERFAALPFEHKVCFTATPQPAYRQVVHIRECREKRVPEGLALSGISYRYFDALDWLKGGTGAPKWSSLL
jgi:uncharacterized protein (DUF1919 family)